MVLCLLQTGGVGGNLNYMSMDLTLFLAGLSAAGVMGAIPLHGRRSQIMWCLALFFGISALVSLKASATSPVASIAAVLWGGAPFIAVAMLLIMSDQRKPTPKPAPKSAVLNPALTVASLNDLIRGATQLEAKRKIEAHSNQIAKIRGRVANIEDDWTGLFVRIIGLKDEDYKTVRMDFRKDQADALALVKPDDWIEFSGNVAYSSIYGWVLKDCEFIARVDPPKPQRKSRRRVA